MNDYLDEILKTSLRYLEKVLTKQELGQFLNELKEKEYKNLSPKG